MLTPALLMVSAGAAKNCAVVGLALTIGSALVFLAAFRGAEKRKGADWRLLVSAVAMFFVGGILLIFGIVGREVAQGQFTH